MKRNRRVRVCIFTVRLKYLYYLCSYGNTTRLLVRAVSSFDGFPSLSPSLSISRIVDGINRFYYRLTESRGRTLRKQFSPREKRRNSIKFYSSTFVFRTKRWVINIIDTSIE